MNRSIALAVSALLLAGSALADPGALARGAELLTPFKRQLQAALKDGLSQGPSQAVAACRLRAPEIAASLSVDGVRVGRASHRLRNPANAPPDWVEPILRAYLADAANREPRTTTLGDQRAGYAEPIATQGLCLVCHGDALAPGVAEQIRELYPEDRAVGFREGELRGVFWVEFPQGDATP
jgi:hypothetical protein